MLNKSNALNHFRKYGRAPYMTVMLHGGPGAPGSMQQPAMVLSSKVGILEPLLNRTSIEEQIEELHEIIALQANTPVKLVGHSWGAWLAWIFAACYPLITEKIILIGAGSFIEQYNVNLTQIRLSRLPENENCEAMILTALINRGEASVSDFRRFGELMSRADSYDCEEGIRESLKFYPEVYNSVWHEAEKLRKKGELLVLGEKIRCPVIAIHGLDDPHPAEGVEKPLRKIMHDFRFIGLEKCGHYPWKEKYAKTRFYEIMENELKGL
jgi:pimeloyl-ACP methyl ester carboxylesterase